VTRFISDAKKGNGIFWGWYVVFGSFSIMIISYGVRYSFGVFVKPMFVEYNWPMTVIQLGSSINLVMYACTGVLTGRLLDRFAPRWIMIVGILATSAGLILASFIKTPLGLYLSYGVLVGAGTAPVPRVGYRHIFHGYRGGDNVDGTARRLYCQTLWLAQRVSIHRSLDALRGNFHFILFYGKVRTRSDRIVAGWGYT